MYSHCLKQGFIYHWILMINRSKKDWDIVTMWQNWVKFPGLLSFNVLKTTLRQTLFWAVNVNDIYYTIVHIYMHSLYVVLNLLQSVYIYIIDWNYHKLIL